MTKNRLANILASAFSLVALPCMGDVVNAPIVQVQVGPAANPQTATPSFTGNGDGTYSSTGSWSTANWLFDWNMTVKPDPFISAAFSIVNNTAVTQTYIVAVALPITPAVTPFSVVGGSIGMTLTDSNNSGFAQVTDTGTGVYFGQNDGVNVLELMDDPFTLTANLFAGQTVIASDVAGLPGPSIPGPPALATIGIFHKFTLTAGDSVGITSFYIVESIPEFGSFYMAGSAGILLAGWLRLRNRRLS